MKNDAIGLWVRHSRRKSELTRTCLLTAPIAISCITGNLDRQIYLCAYHKPQIYSDGRDMNGYRCIAIGY